MSLQPYVRPQDTITQILQQTAEREASRRNPIVIGTQYELYLNDGRDLDDAKQDFNSSGATHSYLDASGTALDLTAKIPVTTAAVLTGEELQALVATFTSGLWSLDESATTLRNIRITDPGVTGIVAGVGTLATVLDGRQVRVGDVLEVTSTTNGNAGHVERRNVVSLLGEVTEATAAASLAKTAAPTNAVANASDSAALVASGTSSGFSNAAFTATDSNDFRQVGKTYTDPDASNVLKLGDELTLTVTTGGAQGVAEVTVSSAAFGVSATGVASSGASDTYTFAIDGLGYTAGTEVSVDHSGALSIAQVIKVRVFPTFTVPVLATDLTVAGNYVGTANLRYVIELFDLDADGDNGTVKIYDTSGSEPITTDADPASGGVLLGTLGLTFTLSDIAASEGYYTGQKFYVDAVAASVDPDTYDGVVLDGPAIDADDYASSPGSTTVTEVKVFQSYTGTLDADNLTGGVGAALTAGSADWTYAAALGLPKEDTGRTTTAISPFEDAYGKVFLSYKAVVVPATTESVIELGSVSEITAALGETDQENWLARGALEAFRGNQNQVVYALRTGGDTVTDFTAALNKIATTDNVYALAPMTDSLDVMKLVKDHCVTMSNKYNKNFRRCYVGTDSPGSYEYWGELPGGGYRTATLQNSILTLDAAYQEAWQFSANDVGSTAKILALDESYEILEVLSDSEVVLDVSTGITVSTPSGITVTRPDTAAATVEFVQNRSTALDSRRAVNVWTDNPTIDDGAGGSEIIQVKFVAAELAGLRCALLPQQGLTMTEVESVEAAPGMYTRFTQEQLDDVAAEGTFVVTQESEGGDVFIRHQLTTETDEGSLASEDNVGVIVDEFSYAVKDEFRSYIGRRNATPDTIAEIDDKLKALAIDFTQVELVYQQIGPAVLTFFDERGNEGEVTVRQDGDLADTLMTYVKLRVPLPLNGINHYIDVDVTELLSSADNV